jgi:hypothetical protein
MKEGEMNKMEIKNIEGYDKNDYITLIGAIFPNKDLEYKGKVYIYTLSKKVKHSIVVGDIIRVTSNHSMTFCGDTVYAAESNAPRYANTSVRVVMVKKVKFTDINNEPFFSAKKDWKEIDDIVVEIPYKYLRQDSDISYDFGTDGSFLCWNYNLKHYCDFNKLMLDREKDQIKTSKQEKQINELKTQNNKEENKMKVSFKNLFDKYKFGKIDTDKIAYSINGVAFKGADGDYRIYNDNGTATNVNDLVFDMPIFVMPVGINDVKKGDIIRHPVENKFIYVRSIGSNFIEAIDPTINEVVNLIPEKSIFGFDFYTKVITITNIFNNTASNETPFGNILPFLFMSDNISDTLPMIMLMNEKNSNMNTMLPFFLMSKGGTGDNDNFLTAMLMSKMFNTNSDKAAE